MSESVYHPLIAQLEYQKNPDDLFRNMCEIVNATVKAHAADFGHDCLLMSLESVPNEYYWCVRSAGTHLVKIGDPLRDRYKYYTIETTMKAILDVWPEDTLVFRINVEKFVKRYPYGRIELVGFPLPVFDGAWLSRFRD